MLKQLTHFCIVREDLPLGVLAAQLVHAAGESSPGDLPPHTTAIVLAARDRTHLEMIEVKLLRLGVPHVAIREPDEPWCNELMAIGVVPADKGDKQLRRVTAQLPLLRDKHDVQQREVNSGHQTPGDRDQEGQGEAEDEVGEADVG